MSLLITASALAQTLTSDPEESAALASLEQSKYARAREQAQKILDQRKSIVATYVLATVQFQAEANHARALFLARRAERWLFKEEGDPPKREEAKLWHKRILLLQEWILGDMDRREEQVELIDRYGALYGPSLEVRKMWPLLKLGRYEEAREIGKRLIHVEDSDIRQRAYNGLMAVEDEARQRKASYDWGMEADRVNGKRSCILASNLALAARQSFRYDQAEAFDRQALNAPENDCPTSPYHQLTTLYLYQGAFQKSLSALVELRKIPRTPIMRVQNEAVIQSRLVELLLALGQLEPATTRVARMVESPDRAGMTSASEENVTLVAKLLHWAVMSARLHQDEERASARGWRDRLTVLVEAKERALKRWEEGRQAIKLAAHDRLLIDIVRPYYTDQAPWLLAEMAPLLGTAVLGQALEEARALETDYPTQAGAYLDAVAAELAWRRGRLSEARALAEGALAALPPGPVLLGLRTRAVLADTAWQQGDAATAETNFRQVMEAWPTALRLLDLALPVRLTDDGSALGREASARLAGSPRLSRGDLGYTVHAEVVADALSVCLLDDGQRRGCGQVALKTVKDGEDPVALAIDAFHERAFAPRIELTQRDLNSLDGQPVRLEAKDAISDVLGLEEENP